MAEVEDNMKDDVDKWFDTVFELVVWQVRRSLRRTIIEWTGE